MSFQQGLSGLNATAKSLEVIGNNIANANTIGAKASRAEFSTLFAASLNGTGTTGPGIGVQMQTVAQLPHSGPSTNAATRAAGLCARATSAGSSISCRR